MRAFEEYLDDLSNWYVRRSRRRFWDGEEEALRTLWYALVQTLRVLAPILPFLTDHLWRNLVASDGAPTRCTSPAGPRRRSPTASCSPRSPRCGASSSSAGARAATPGIKNSPAAAAARRRGRAARGGARGRDRRRAAREGGRVRPRRGGGAAREAEPARARAEARQGARRGAGGARGRASSRSSGAAASVSSATSSSRTRCSSSAAGARAGRSPRPTASTVALELALDDELLLEADAYDLIHRVNSLRKEQGLELTDRIVLTVPGVAARSRRAARRLDRRRGARDRDPRRRRAHGREDLVRRGGGDLAGETGVLRHEGLVRLLGAAAALAMEGGEDVGGQRLAGDALVARGAQRLLDQRLDVVERSRPARARAAGRRRRAPSARPPRAPPRPPTRPAPTPAARPRRRRRAAACRPGIRGRARRATRAARRSRARRAGT